MSNKFNCTRYMLLLALAMFMPNLILLFSGKRKSGKDFIAEQLFNSLGDSKCAIVRISEPIKSHYAKEKNLDLAQLMGDSAYKEMYRIEMIVWSDEVRSRDPGYFCRAACEKAKQSSIWIVSDMRRKTDLAWFKENYGQTIRTVRIGAMEDIRVGRGFKFTAGVDDVTSECDLDTVNSWDLVIANNNNEDLEAAMKQLLDLIEPYL